MSHFDSKTTQTIILYWLCTKIDVNNGCESILF